MQAIAVILLDFGPYRAVDLYKTSFRKLKSYMGVSITPESCLDIIPIRRLVTTTMKPIKVSPEGNLRFAYNFAYMKICYSTILTGRQFLQASWNLCGSQCLVSDRKGTILLVDVRLNTWKKIAQLSLVPSLLEFGLAKSDEFLVALPNCEIRCLNTSGALMSIMGGHKTQVSAIRVSPD